MDRQPTSTTVDQEIHAALTPIAAVALAYVFGSRASETHRPDSDLDVAVSFASTLSDAERGARLLDVLAALDGLGPRIDLLDLDRSSATIGFRVIRDGRCVLNRLPRHRTHLEATIARRYDDERPYRELFRTAARAAAVRMGKVRS